MTSRARAPFVLDLLIVILVAAVGVLWLIGGFTVQVSGVRISAHHLDRPVVAVLILAFVRWRFFRDAGFLRRPGDWYRQWWSRTYQPRADDSLVAPMPRRWWHGWLAALGLAGLGAVMMRTQLRHMDSVADMGDPLFSIWRMDWVYRQLGGDPRPLFDANIFHPTPLTLTMSDSMLLPAVTNAPLLAAGIAPIVAYNILFLSGFFLSGVAAYLLVRRLTGSSQAAFIGGLLYAFYPYRIEHYSHLELQMTQWMPLALLFLHRFAGSFRPRDAVLAGLCLVAQLYSSMYYGVFFLFYAAAVLGVLLTTIQAPWRRLAGPAVVAGVVALALAFPLARPYLAGQAIKGDRESYVVRYYSAQVADYLRPTPRLALYGGRLLPDIHAERALFPGVTPVALTAFAFASPIGPIRLAYAAGLAVSLDMSLGLNGVLYPFFYEVFPPLRGMRSPARFSVIMAISLVVLGAFGARRLLARARTPRARSTMFAALVAAIVIDLWPTLTLMPVWASPPPIYDTLAGRPDVVLVEYPFETPLPGTTGALPFMYFSSWHGRQMVNGYSGFSPRDYDELMERVVSFPDEASLSALRSRGATHVTVNCALIVADCAPVLDRTDRSPLLRLVKSAEWQGEAVRLYEFLR